MNAQELRAAKQKMELAIRDAVCDAMQDFYVTTGLKPCSIGVEMTAQSFVGANFDNYMCTGVHAHVAL